MIKVLRVLSCVLLLLGAASPPAHAEAYPARPITLLVPFSAGSGTDQVARGLAQALAEEWKGSTAVIDNRPGASGIIAAQAAARAAPDGYTLLVTTNTTQAANPFLFRKLPYDPAADFVPITSLARGSLVLAVAPGSPFNTVVDVIAAARQRTLNFGAGNSSSRIAGEQFKQMTGVNLGYVPYKSNPQAINDLLGGRLDLMFADMATALPLVQSGKLRAIAYTALQRYPALPAVPTLDESGVKGFNAYYWLAVYAPKGTPADLVQRLNTALVKIARSPVMETVFRHAALDVFTSTPGELASFQRSEIEKWGRIIKAAAIVPE